MVRFEGRELEIQVFVMKINTVSLHIEAAECI